MNRAERIEEVLRHSAPDEPGHLEPLDLLDRLPAPVQGHTRAGRTVRGSRLSWVVIAAIGMITLAIGIQTATSARPVPSAPSAQGTSAHQAPVTTATPSTAEPSSDLTTLEGVGLSVRVPDGWHIWWFTGGFGTGDIAVIGNGDLSSCAASADQGCLDVTPYGPGEIRIAVQAPLGGLFGGIADPAREFSETIDGMPAIVDERAIDAQSGRVGRTWQIAKPGVFNAWYALRATTQSPATDAFREQVDAIARSVRLERTSPAPPTDDAGTDLLIATALDSWDRRARENYLSSYYGCFPRHVGSSAPTVIDDGPGGVHLLGPLGVVCSVSVEHSPFELLRVTLNATWSDGPGYDAGRRHEVLDVNGSGEVIGDHIADAPVFPVTRPDATLTPTTTPPELPPSSLAQIRYPDVRFYRATEPDEDMASVPFGEHVWIVGGPKVVGGVRWYRVQWQPAATMDPLPGWMPDTIDGHPAVSAVAARCPEIVGDVTDITGLAAAERLVCFGDRDIKLEHVMLTEAPTNIPKAAGSPAWLAADSSRIAMYGSAGAAGVEGPLLVVVAPTVSDVPRNTWVAIVGHFDDPAASTCSRSWTIADAPAYPVETGSEQVLLCRERFVITTIRASSAP